MAASIGWNADLVCTLIVLIAFTIFVSGAASGFKVLMDSFSVFPARKYLITRGLSKENSIIVSKQMLYIITTIVVYSLYFPFLVRLNPAFSGIVLVLVVLFMSLLALKALRASYKTIIVWIFS